MRWARASAQEIKRVTCRLGNLIVLLGFALGWAVEPAIDSPCTVTSETISGVEVLSIAVDVRRWPAVLVPTEALSRFRNGTDYLVINGGYFNAAHQPDGLVITGTTTQGKLRHESPYSGFVWADAAGLMHIERRADPPAAATWAIQSGPLLVEGGRSGINTSQSVAPRSVLALRAGTVLVIRTGPIGLKDLAEALVRAGVEVAVNLDGGPSADLHVRIRGVATDRPGTAQTPYVLGFAPPAGLSQP
jgi:hypothetical protein